ncbi:MAG: hypothetical protein ACOZEN_09705 [Thermodesulfobacteriota bacterium]
MPEPKPPILLKVLIVAVALLLGASLNMFQRGGPFWGGGSGAGQKQPSSALLAKAPGGEPDAPPKASPPAGEGAVQPERVSNSSSLPSGKENEAVESPGAPSTDAGKEKPAADGGTLSPQEGKPGFHAGSGTGPAPSEDAAGAAPQSPPAPDDAGEAPHAVDAARAAGEPGLVLPRVTAESSKARAAGIGRSVPVGDAKPAQPGAPEALEAHQGPKVSDGGAAGDGVRAEALPEKPESPSSSVKPGPEDRDGQSAKSGTAGGKVLGINVRENPREFVLTIVTDGPVERVTAFHAKSPARLGVDLWGDWQPSAPLARPLGGPAMERLRQGVHPGKLRLVIDYKDKDLSAFSEPVLEKQPRAVVIRLPLLTAPKRDGAREAVQTDPEQ